LKLKLLEHKFDFLKLNGLKLQLNSSLAYKISPEINFMKFHLSCSSNIFSFVCQDTSIGRQRRV